MRHHWPIHKCIASSTHMRVHASSSANTWEYCIADLYTRKCVIVCLMWVLHLRLIHEYMRHSRPALWCTTLSNYTRVYTSSLIQTSVDASSSAYTREYSTVDLYTSTYVILDPHMGEFHRRLIHEYIRHRWPTHKTIASSTYTQVHAWSWTYTSVDVPFSAYTPE